MDLRELAEKFIQTYTLEEILELAGTTDEEFVYLLLINGLLDPELPVEL